MAESHVGGALLVAAADEADAVAGPVHRIEKMIELPAGQPIDGVHAVGQELGQQRIGPAHLLHDLPLQILPPK